MCPLNHINTRLIAAFSVQYTQIVRLAALLTLYLQFGLGNIMIQYCPGHPFGTTRICQESRVLMTLALDTEIYGQIETRIDLWCLLLPSVALWEPLMACVFGCYFWLGITLCSVLHRSMIGNATGSGILGVPLLQ